MLNRDIKYTLSEVGAQLGLSHAWVKKIEKYFKFPPWGSGRRGKKSYYSAQQFELFRKIVMLRRLDLGLEDIKGIYDAEKEILHFADKYFPVDGETEPEDVRCIVVYLITNVFCTSGGIEHDSAKCKKRRAETEKLEEMIREYEGVIKIILERIDSYCQKLKEERGDLKAILGSR